MKIRSIASGSKGNCYQISDGSSSLLVECGIQFSKIIKSVDLTSVSGCLITHEHRDHCQSHNEISKYVDIYASLGTIEALNADKDKSYKYKVLKHNQQVDIGTFTVIPFDTQHDSNEPLGFLIYSSVTKEKLLFATDTYYIKSRFNGLNYIMIECNYSKETIKEGLSKTEYQRLIQSHFSLENVKKFLEATDLLKLKEVYLIHMSSRNADEYLFKQEIEAIVGVPVIVCGG